jgi:hypothetical protein
MLLRILSATLILPILGGCSVDTFTYTINRYGEVKGTHVHLGCHDTYEVFDRKDAGSFVVVTSGLNEALVDTCGSFAGVPQAERTRRIADIYLAETSARPACRVTRQTPLTDFHTEFSYSCPAPFASQPRIRRRP